MSTTLTNGLKLPDKGSVDWYADMQNNYTILDSSVGTIAEHTSALSGKAPLVHTHTKSDVTDLFNSANTWTNSNTYSKAITVEKNSDTDFFFNTKHTAAELGSLPSSDQSITWAFKDKNDDNLCYARVYYETTGGNSFRIFVRNKFTSGAPSTSGTVDYAYFGLKLNADKSKEGILRASFRPYDNNTYDLGSSSYQWNNLYANGYYYNGVAWGLDKENTWSKTNYFSPSMYQKAFTARASIPSSNEFAAFIIGDSNNASVMSLNYANRAIGVRDLSLRVYDYSGNANGVMVVKDANNNYGFCSINPNDTINLGTSTNKWKTLNGINPGALSLPNLTANSPATQNPPNGWISIDTTNWDKTGNLISYIPPVDGWISIITDNSSATNYIRCAYDNGDILAKANGNGYAQGLSVFLPVLKNVQIGIRLVCTTIGTAKLYPCLGNV